MNIRQIKSDINKAFKRYIAAPKNKSFNPIPNSLTSGKLYEAFTLGIVAQELTSKEGIKLVLVSGNKIRLKSSPGPINRNFPYIEVLETRTNIKIAEIWTDIEFLTFSYAQRSGFSPPERGEYHELDIVMIDSNQTNRPSHDSIWLGVECKNTKYDKQLLKEILGIRRELSLLSDYKKTKFQVWPRSIIPSDPPSCLLVYSTSAAVMDYKSPGDIFGIDFYYKPL